MAQLPLIHGPMLGLMLPFANVGGGGAPPLPPPAGPVIRAASVGELQAAVDTLEDGATIVVADGEYRLDRFLHLTGRRNVALRGESGDPRRVMLLGRGWDVGDQFDDILRIGNCDGVTIADLTFRDSRSYGIKVEAENNPRDVQIYNCRFRDIGTRAIKGSASRECKAVGGSVRFCDFENTRVPPPDWLFDGDYISGIDMMALEDWTFSDNVFRNIRGRNGAARAAIFLWVRSRRVVVERNLILGCDRAIAFGNPSASTATNPDELHMTDAICRNNAIVCGPDAGIELAWVTGVRVAHNTVWREEGRGRGIRCIEKITDTHLANNLIRGELMLTDGVTVAGNVVGDLDGYFVDAPAGDLHLTANAADAIDQAQPLADITDDMDGRPRDEKPDVGAYERGVD